MILVILALRSLDERSDFHVQGLLGIDLSHPARRYLMRTTCSETEISP
jgi:hypothetical protein